MMKLEKDIFIDDKTWRFLEEQSKRVDEAIKRIREDTRKAPKASAPESFQVITPTTSSSPNPSTFVGPNPVVSPSLNPRRSVSSRLATWRRLPFHALPRRTRIVIFSSVGFIGLIGIVVLTLRFVNLPSSSTKASSNTEQTTSYEAPNPLTSSSQEQIIAASPQVYETVPAPQNNPMSPVYQSKSDSNVTSVKMIAIRVQSNPAGAQVYFNDKLLGVTPLKLEKPPGKYRLRLVKDGYPPIGSTIKISSASKKDFFYDLSP